jgi:hypothetical protein
MKVYSPLDDHDSCRFAEAAPAPTWGRWLFEPLAENQDGHGSHREHLSAGQQHGEQHQRPARTSTPNPMRYPEAKRVKICGNSKRG